jgi:hypothetical protein
MLAACGCHIVVVGAQEEQRRRIGWGGHRLEHSRVDRRGEVGPAFGRVIQGDAGCQVAPGGESHHPHPVGLDAPFRRPLAHQPHRLLPVRRCQREDGLQQAKHLRPVSHIGLDFFSKALLGADQAVA